MLRATARNFVKGVLGSYTSRWPQNSRLFLVGDEASWSISWDMRELSRIASRLGITTGSSFLKDMSSRQSVFLGSQFFLLSDDWTRSSHAVATAYFHGKPGTGVEEFDILHDKLRRNHQNLARVQVSHSEMEQLILETGISPEKVFLIPIGINPAFFSFQSPQSKHLTRARLGIPQSAVVVGSFHKDGSGWGEGLEPKLIKGPDILLKALRILGERTPELHVLLTGPSRGYVKQGLEKISVPYTHVYLKKYPEIGQLYHALDLYLVPSRQEGGPKAVLESMASGIPLVTTRVGQAADLVRHGENGFIVDVEDSEGLAYWSEHVLRHPSELQGVLRRGRKTAEENTYDSQSDLWRRFMNGFVLMKSGERDRTAR